MSEMYPETSANSRIFKRLNTFQLTEQDIKRVGNSKKNTETEIKCPTFESSLNC